MAGPLNLEFRRMNVDDVDVDTRTVVGHAAVFGNKDAYGDVIERGAFAETLKQRGNRVKVFYNHTFPIGRPEVMQEDERGLYTESKISSTPRGEEVLQLVREGVIDEMSIAFETVKSERTEDGGRTLKELRLYEYGPVDFAANDQAIIQGVKSLTQRLEQGQSSVSMDEIKSALNALQSIIGSDPSQDSHESDPPKSSRVDTSIVMLGSDFATQIAEAAKLHHKRSQ